MTHTEAATKLLRLGPLTPAEFRQITGWPAQQCRNSIRWLAETHRIRRVSGGKWGLA